MSREKNNIYSALEKEKMLDIDDEMISHLMTNPLLYFLSLIFSYLVIFRQNV